MERTDKVVREATKLALSVEGTAHTAGFAGFDGATLHQRAQLPAPSSSP